MVDIGPPSEPGVYWARSSSRMEWYDLVVQVEGVVPFLRAERALTLSGRGFDLPTVVWGPRIPRPETPRGAR